MKKPIITEEEKQKIKEMDSTRKKIGYIWDYYKLWIIGAVVLVGLVVYFTVVFATREDKPILDVVLVNNYDDVSEDCRLTQGFVSYVGEENLPVTEVKLPGEGETKKRCKPRKKACSGAFWRPREDLNLRPHA